MSLKPPPPASLSVDDSLTIVDDLGPWWRLRTFLTLGLFVASGGAAVVSWTFTAFAVDMRCSVPICDGPSHSASFSSDWVRRDQQDSCRRLLPANGTAIVTCADYLLVAASGGDMVASQCPADELIADPSVRHSSLLLDLGLVCDQAHLSGAVGASYMLGMLLGSVAVGPFSDRFGRRIGVTASAGLMAAAGVAGAMAKGPVQFAVTRFLTGTGGISVLICSFVLFMESLPSHQLVFWSMLLNVPFAAGEALLGAAAYLVRDWRGLQAATFLPMLLLPLLYFTLQESPRWLLSVGRRGEAAAVLGEMARFNIKWKRGTKASPQAHFHEAWPAPASQWQTKKQMAEGDLGGDGRSSSPLLTLLRSEILLLRSLTMGFQWFSVTLCFYGLSFASTSLSGDPYLNFLLSVAVELPAYLAMAAFLERIGRRPILVGLQSISGLSCMAAGVLFHLIGQTHGDGGADGLLAGCQLAFSLLGKFGATANFAIIFLYTSELFPTAQRATVTGFCSTVARFGAILSLFLQTLGSLWPPLPMLLMGSSALAAAATAGVALPETGGGSGGMPDTLEQAESMGRFK